MPASLVASRKTTRSRQVPPSTSTRGDDRRADRPAAAVAPREQPVDQQRQRALELRPGRRLGQRQGLLDALARRARAKRRVTTERELPRPQPGGPKRSATAARPAAPPARRAWGSPGARASRAAARSPRSGAAAPPARPPDRARRQRSPRAAPARATRPPARRTATAPRRSAPGAASAARVAATTPSSVPPCRRRRPRASKHARPGAPGSTAAPTDSRRPSISSQASFTETGSGGTSASSGAARQRLPQPHPGMHAEGLCGRRHLADQLLPAGLGRQRGRARHQRVASAGGDRKLETREQDADDGHEHMFAPSSSAPIARFEA